MCYFLPLFIPINLFYYIYNELVESDINNLSIDFTESLGCSASLASTTYNFKFNNVLSHLWCKGGLIIT